MNKFVMYGLVIVSVALGTAWFVFGDAIIERGDLLYTPNEPTAVANDFWITALNETDTGAARYLSGDSLSETLIPGYSKQDRAILGKSEQSNGTYYIKTTLMLFRDGQSTQVPLYTVVVSEDGLFKVDLNSTLSSAQDAALDNALSYYASAAKHAYRLFPGTQLSADEKVLLLDANLSNLEERMCAVRSEVIKTVLPSYAQSASTPAYCE
ncbi:MULTISPECIES: hypothetical protein [Salinimonas]|uniref:Uncharacterized protein n=2 Tax=Salinimonas TaxID=288793 RepID=A0A5B7YJB7_9ALTE|nr:MULTISPECIES: hypothetical protein [Salinimonas]MBD3587709.1 hypothetical protein [Salinimonas profundi]QCZ95410.1 hypothetical protein FBQ74_17900 [Salinimonas iocasae]